MLERRLRSTNASVLLDLRYTPVIPHVHIVVLYDVRIPQRKENRETACHQQPGIGIRRRSHLRFHAQLRRRRRRHLHALHQRHHPDKHAARRCEGLRRRDRGGRRRHRGWCATCLPTPAYPCCPSPPARPTCWPSTLQARSSLMRLPRWCAPGRPLISTWARSAWTASASGSPSWPERVTTPSSCAGPSAASACSAPWPTSSQRWPTPCRSNRSSRSP